MTHTLPQLPYAYYALEPHFDAQTMQIHHTKHHQTYIDKLNAALQNHPQLQGKTAEELLQNFESIPADIKTAVQNHAGGHANHSLFWQILSSQKQQCSGAILTKITAKFGSYDAFVTEFTNAALNRFGSGWAWLVQNADGSIEIMSTPNQDSPLMQNKTPLLGIDVWEHAYYLKYQQKRPDYIKAFFEIINWEKVNTLLK